ncbi:MAG: response regulator [Armatimonadota bacterium]
MQCRILLVEDEPENQLVIGLILKTEGYSVITVDRGDAALEAAEREKPDLVLLDVMMPEVNGFDVLARLRQNPATASIPVILLTALAQERDVERAVNAGVNGFVAKPFEPGELISCVRSALASSGFCQVTGVTHCLEPGAGDGEQHSN